MAIGLTFWASTDVWNCSLVVLSVLGSVSMETFGSYWICHLGPLDLIGSTLWGVWIILVKMNYLLYELLFWHIMVS